MEQLKNESSRQYEYMEEMKKWVQKKSEELGRKLTCHVTTFGCQMNEKDSEKLLGILETIGYEEVETEEADLIYVWTWRPDEYWGWTKYQYATESKYNIHKTLAKQLLCRQSQITGKKKCCVK